MNFLKPAPGRVNCVGCRALNVKGCEECRRCRERCGCICRECWNCTPMALTEVGRRHFGKPVKHHPKYFCVVCRRCKRHGVEEVAADYQCTCRKRPSGTLRHPIVDAGSYRNTLNRALGLEIEVSVVGTTAALNLPPFVRYQWVHDGSITAGGQEMVLDPLIGDNFIRGIGALQRELERFEFAVDKSCGFHVHVAAKEFGPYELRRLMLLYKQFEDVFYNLVAPGRDGYREVRGERKYYCKRFPMEPEWYDGLRALTTHQQIRKYLFEWLYADKLQRYRDRNTGLPYKRKARTVFNGGCRYSLWPARWKEKEYGALTMPQHRAHKYENARYLGLNIHTWLQRGTVEYRHHEGTLAPDKLLYWPLWCGWFTEVASVMTDREVAQCNSLDALLDTPYKRAYHVTVIPPFIRDWVRTTLRDNKKENV